jgi:hypothetical protein
MKFHPIAIGVAALSLAACISQPLARVSVVFTSNPAGAVVLRDGMPIGRTPLTVSYYDLLKTNGSGALDASQCPFDSPLTFRWTSGAEAIVNDPCQTSSVSAPVRASAASGPRNAQLNSQNARVAYQVNASRPQGAPGLDKDLLAAASRNTSATSLGGRTVTYSSAADLRYYPTRTYTSSWSTYDTNNSYNSGSYSNSGSGESRGVPSSGGGYISTGKLPLPPQ